MGLDDMFSGKKTFTIIAMIILLVGLIGDFVTTIVWWNRIQPWFSHGKGDGLTVYQCLIACWVLSLIGVIVVAIFLIFTLFVSSICDSITGNSVVLIVCIALIGAVSVGSIVSGAYGGSYALKNPNIEDEDEDNKCAKYIASGIEGITNWLMNGHLDKAGDWQKFQIDLQKKIIKDDGSVDYGILCMDVGVTTLVFALVQCIAIILFIVDIIMSCTGFSKISQK